MLTGGQFFVFMFFWNVLGIIVLALIQVIVEGLRS